MVSSCPNTKTDWEARSLELKCNSTNQYHCNQFNTSQLYEFCYKRDAFKVHKGTIQCSHLNTYKTYQIFLFYTKLRLPLYFSYDYRFIRFL